MADDAHLCLIGGGEHARVVAESAALAGWRIVGCFATQAPAYPGLPWLGDDGALAARRDEFRGASFHCAVVGGPGSPVRRDLIARLAPLGLRWAAVRHPRATVSPSARVGDGAFIAAGAIVNVGARLGEHAIINTGAIAEHDVDVDDGANLAPGAIVGGAARIGAWAFVGLGARVRDHVAIGARAVVGMGAVVVGHVPPGATVVGVPAHALAGAPR